MKKLKIAFFGIDHNHCAAKVAELKTLPDLFEIKGIVCENDEVYQRRVINDKTYEGLKFISEEELFLMDDIDAVVSHCKTGVQMLVFSATIVEGLKPFLKKYMEGAVIVDIDDDKTSNNVTHYALDCKERDKMTYLVSLLDNINPYVCLIFSSKKTNVDMIYKKLNSLSSASAPEFVHPAQ